MGCYEALSAMEAARPREFDAEPWRLLVARMPLRSHDEHGAFEFRHRSVHEYLLVAARNGLPRPEIIDEDLEAAARAATDALRAGLHCIHSSFPVCCIHYIHTYLNPSPLTYILPLLMFVDDDPAALLPPLQPFF